MVAMPQPRIKLPHQAAKYIGASTSHLAKLRCSGVGPPFVKIGANRVGYLVDDLDRWLESRRQTSTR